MTAWLSRTCLKMIFLLKDCQDTDQSYRHQATLVIIGWKAWWDRAQSLRFSTQELMTSNHYLLMSMLNNLKRKSMYRLTTWGTRMRGISKKLLNHTKLTRKITIKNIPIDNPKHVYSAQHAISNGQAYLRIFQQQNNSPSLNSTTKMRSQRLRMLFLLKDSALTYKKIDSKLFRHKILWMTSLLDLEPAVVELRKSNRKSKKSLYTETQKCIRIHTIPRMSKLISLILKKHARRLNRPTLLISQKEEGLRNPLAR